MVDMSTIGIFDFCSDIMLPKDNMMGMLPSHGDCLKLQHDSRLHTQLLSITACMNSIKRTPAHLIQLNIAAHLRL